MEFIPREILEQILGKGIIAYLEMRAVCRHLSQLLPPINVTRDLILRDPDLHLYPHYRRKIRRRNTNMIKSVQHGNLENMKWLLFGTDHKPKPEDDYDLDYLESIWDNGVFKKAATLGNLEIMKWLYEQDCPFNTYGNTAFVGAARNGNIENMKWLKSVDDTWNFKILSEAISAGNFEALKWLRNPVWINKDGMQQNGEPCPWGPVSPFEEAVKVGNLEILKWIQSAGCPYKNSHFKAVCDIEVAEWLISQGIFDAGAFGPAFVARNLRLLRLISDHAIRLLERDA